MSLIPKSFHELLNMHFIIPPYQRGYRWDVQQVTDLLHDLHAFVRKYCGPLQQSSTDGKVPYYCLQPIAVVEAYDKDNTYYLVDGQQRITTIYLLLHFIREKIIFQKFPIYDISLPSRDHQNDYLNNLNFKNKEADHDSNIDNFYLRKAYETIEEWYDPEGEHAAELYNILALFIKQPGHQEQREVRVIWYEIVDRSPIDAFRNLNYGKIPLTATELVKALLLQTEESPLAGQHLRGAAYRRALEWDTMEHSLQNPTLWSMLVDCKDETSSHIEIVLDFVADRLNDEMWEADKKSSDGSTKVSPPFKRKSQSVLAQGNMHDNFNYYVVDEYIRRHGSKSIEDKIWREICLIYNLIKNWYDNREWYHLIGLCRILQNEKTKKTRREFLTKIYNLSIDSKKRPIDRGVFTERLRKEIGNTIKLNNVELDNLNYNDHKADIIRILETLNVKTAIDNPTEGNRFAFDLFDTFKVTSLEHIHPQNITSDASYEDFKNWVDRRGEDFITLTLSDYINIVQTQSDISNYDEEILRDKAEKLKGDASNALSILKEMSRTSKVYNEVGNKEAINAAVKTFDRLFEEMAGITEAELHSIKNLALVDKDTNSALQNFFLDKKRSILEILQAKCSLKPKKGTYVPPATRAVFNKKYSSKHPGDMRLWRRDDRENYFNEIVKIYNYFTR